MPLPSVSVLFDILERERQCCAALIEVGKEEQRSLVDNDLDKLNTRTKEMQKAVTDLSQLHQERKQHLDQIAEELGLDQSQVSLQEVISQLQDDSAQKLKIKVQELLKTGETLYRVNRQTIYLINFSMGLVDKQISNLADVLSETDGYGQDGKSVPGKTRPKIVEGKV